MNKKPYQKLSPCHNCPYRLDAPLRHWHFTEFVRLLLGEKEELGWPVFGCHKKDGNTCIGWLMNQVDNDLPSIMGRLSLSQHGVTSEYLDSLHCSSDRFETIVEMCRANYPELFTDKYLKKLLK